MSGVPKPEALNLTKNSLHNEHLQAKLFGQRGIAASSSTKMNEEELEK